MRLSIVSPLPGNTHCYSGVFTGGLIVGFSPRGGEFVTQKKYAYFVDFNTRNIESAANKEGDLTLGIAPTIRAFDEGGCQIPTTSPLLPRSLKSAEWIICACTKSRRPLLADKSRACGHVLCKMPSY